MPDNAQLAEHSVEDEMAVAALLALASANIPTDVQELLVYGNPSRGIPPGALSACFKAALARRPTPRVSEEQIALIIWGLEVDQSCSDCACPREPDCACWLATIESAHTILSLSSLASQVEKLTVERDEAVHQRQVINDYANIDLRRAERAEAELAKALEALEGIDKWITSLPIAKEWNSITTPSEVVAVSAVLTGAKP